jgi:hypothetical protein
MFSKCLRVVLAATIVLLPFQGQLFAASPVTITAEGTLTGVSTLTVRIFNINDGSTNTTGLGLNGGAGAGVVTSPQGLQVNYDDNSVGFQTVAISTNNRDAAASPKYTGPGIGSGMVGKTDTKATVPLAWTVFNDPVNPPAGATPGTGYSFQAAINSDKGEFFMSDKRQGEAAECRDSVTGAFESGAACDADDPIVDWDGDGVKGAKPFDGGFASLVTGIAGKIGSLSDASGFNETTGVRGPLGRSTTDGEVFMYLCTTYTGAEAQGYKTSTLTVEILTLA